MRSVLATIVAVEKQYVLHIVSVCVCVWVCVCVCVVCVCVCVCVALVIQHAMRVSHIVPVRLYDMFPHFCINGKIFGKKYGI